MRKYQTAYTKFLGTEAEKRFAKCLIGSQKKGYITSWEKANIQNNTIGHIDFHIYLSSGIFKKQNNTNMGLVNLKCSNQQEKNKCTRPEIEKVCDIEVKGLKRLRALPHFKPQSKFLYVEIEAAGNQFKNTKSGWLYDGLAHYIAFQLDGSDKITNEKDCFLLVDRHTLIDYVDTHVNFTSTVKYPSLAVYKKYTRITEGKHRGSITLIPLQNLLTHLQFLSPSCKPSPLPENAAAQVLPGKDEKNQQSILFAILNSKGEFITTF